MYSIYTSDFAIYLLFVLHIYIYTFDPIFPPNHQFWGHLRCWNLRGSIFCLIATVQTTPMWKNVIILDSPTSFPWTHFRHVFCSYADVFFFFSSRNQEGFRIINLAKTKLVLRDITLKKLTVTKKFQNRKSTSLDQLIICWTLLGRVLSQKHSNFRFKTWPAMQLGQLFSFYIVPCDRPLSGHVSPFAWHLAISPEAERQSLAQPCNEIDFTKLAIDRYRLVNTIQYSFLSLYYFENNNHTQNLWQNSAPNPEKNHPKIQELQNRISAWPILPLVFLFGCLEHMQWRFDQRLGLRILGQKKERLPHFGNQILVFWLAVEPTQLKNMGQNGNLPQGSGWT